MAGYGCCACRPRLARRGSGAPAAGPWAAALASDRPVILEVKTDPEVAPLPPHLTLAQAKAFMSSMAKGDRGAGRVIAETARQLFKEVTG